MRLNKAEHWIAYITTNMQVSCVVAEGFEILSAMQWSNLGILYVHK